MELSPENRFPDRNNKKFTHCRRRVWRVSSRACAGAPAAPCRSVVAAGAFGVPLWRVAPCVLAPSCGLVAAARCWGSG
eukprot:1505184-Alexandrium_andersonii.AAC.1